MRRQIIVLLIALFLTGAVWAGYPEEYYGPPLPFEGCIEIEAYTPDGWYHDRNPWSSAPPSENVLWLGTLCHESGIAVLEFTHLATKYCYENPLGFEECYAWMGFAINTPDRHVMPWDPSQDPELGFYQAMVSGGNWNYWYDSLTVNSDVEFVFVEGVWYFTTPFWWDENDDFTRWKFLVNEKVTPIFGLRKGGRRVGK